MSWLETLPAPAATVALGAVLQGQTLADALGDAGWTWSSLVAVVVSTAGLFAYAGGVLVARQRGGLDRWQWARALAFVSGLAALCIAVVGPLHALGRFSLGAHMGQHMLLFAYAPLLLVLGRPGELWLQARAGASPGQWPHPAQGLLASAASALVAATAVHSALMWFWHHPAAITTTLFDDRLQLLMQASFVLSGLWFWSALARRLRSGREGLGVAMVALVAMMMQMGLLGALLTFSARVLYPVCSERAPLLGLEPLADQQLAGLIMWVPAGLPYLLGGLWLMQRWLALPDQDRAAA